jgi:hypothetical protein
MTPVWDFVKRRATEPSRRWAAGFAQKTTRAQKVHLRELSANVSARAVLCASCCSVRRTPFCRLGLTGPGSHPVRAIQVDGNGQRSFSGAYPCGYRRGTAGVRSATVWTLRVLYATSTASVVT